MSKDLLNKLERSERNHFKNISNRYDDIYGYRSTFGIYKMRKKVELFCKYLDKGVSKRKLKILEIGCGTGEYSKLLSEKFPKAKIVAVDVSPDVIRIAKDKNRNRKNLSFKIQSVYNLNYPNSSFDIICGFYVLHHLKIERVKVGLIRLLKRNGYVYFCEPNFINPVTFSIWFMPQVKKAMGYSPNEKALNPITLPSQLSPLKTIKITTSEYMWPISLLGVNLLKFIDMITSALSYVPGINLFGGSIHIWLKK